MILGYNNKNEGDVWKLLANVEDKLIRGIRKGWLSWFDFVAGLKTLYIGSEEDPLSDLLKKAGLNIEFAHLEQILDVSWISGKLESFDYDVIGEMVESTQEPVAYLMALKKFYRGMDVCFFL